jgi:symplekin
LTLHSREVGFATLRGFVLQRPSLRQEALHALLDLTTHPGMRHFNLPLSSSVILLDRIELKTRAAAINTVRQWVPGAQPIDDMVRRFALQMLRRLHEAGKRGANAKNGESMDTADDAPEEELAQTPYLAEYVELPAQKQEVLQHVELLFALSVKAPELLD